MGAGETTFFERAAETALEKEEFGDYILKIAGYALESAAGRSDEGLSPKDQIIENAAEKYFEKIRDGETSIEVDEESLYDIHLFTPDKMFHLPNLEDMNYSARLIHLAYNDVPRKKKREDVGSEIGFIS